MTDYLEEQLIEIVFQALGEESAIFMSSPTPGNQQIMPTAQIRKLGDKVVQQLRTLIAERNRVAVADELDGLRAAYRATTGIQEDLFVEALTERIDEMRRSDHETT
jgi:hypothetical protein